MEIVKIVSAFDTPTIEEFVAHANVMDMVKFRMIFFELLVFFTFALLTLHFAY